MILTVPGTQSTRKHDGQLNWEGERGGHNLDLQPSDIAFYRGYKLTRPIFSIITGFVRRPSQHPWASHFGMIKSVDHLGALLVPSVRFTFRGECGKSHENPKDTTKSRYGYNPSSHSLVKLQYTYILHLYYIYISRYMYIYTHSHDDHIIAAAYSR